MVQCAPHTARPFIRRTHSAGVRSAACKPPAITISKLLNRNSTNIKPIHRKTITSLPKTRTLPRVYTLSSISYWPTTRRRQQPPGDLLLAPDTPPPSRTSQHTQPTFRQPLHQRSHTHYVMR